MIPGKAYPERYDEQLADKLRALQSQFSAFKMPKLETFESPKTHYRMRAEFKIWQQGERAHYAMYQPGEYKKPILIDEFSIGSQYIVDLMPHLLSAINASAALRQRLFQVEFLSSLAGEVLVTLIYHKALDDQWDAEASTLETALKCKIIGRSRKQKRVLSTDYITESLQVGEEFFHYQQVETGFTQPNARVCESMLSWACRCAEQIITQQSDNKKDLLELYCGNGNFTLPLSRRFDKVLATEVSKTSVNSARFNIEKNACENIEIIRLASEEVSAALAGEREFRRLQMIQLEDYNFSTVFVDPPRAGLDDATVELVSRFDNILYISCNPDTLKRNLEALDTSHEPVRFAAFDQFPYTHHLECGLWLRKRQ